MSLLILISYNRHSFFQRACGAKCNNTTNCHPNKINIIQMNQFIVFNIRSWYNRFSLISMPINNHIILFMALSVYVYCVCVSDSLFFTFSPYSVLLFKRAKNYKCDFIVFASIQYETRFSCDIDFHSIAFDDKNMQNTFTA